MNSKLGSGRGLIALAISTTALFSGCGGPWIPSGVGPPVEVEEERPGALSDSALTLEADTVAPPPGAEEEIASALSGGTSDEPRVVYLIYADGNPLGLSTSLNPCPGTPPKFVCKFGSTLLDCQKKVQAYLDEWYANLNVVFTLTRPARGRYYTSVVSSGGGEWCDLDSRVAGIAPFTCGDLNGGISYVLYGGEDAKQTAVIIAHEQGHLVGLEHTSSNNDAMYPSVCRDCDGFQDRENGIRDAKCGHTTQNSARMMRERQGLFTGSSKPSPFACLEDGNAPRVRILDPVDGATVAGSFSVRVDAGDDCTISSVRVAVSPLALEATSATPPYQWDLTNITGSQTITVTATDGAGHSATARVTVNAPAELPPEQPSGGCAVLGDAGGAESLVVGLAALVLVLRRRGARRRPDQP